MENRNCKQFYTQCQSKVSSKLMEWDPIGCGVPDDEYAAYAQTLIYLLNRGATKTELMEYLEKVSTEQLGMPNPRDRAEKVIDDLYVWWPEKKAKFEAGKIPEN